MSCTLFLHQHALCCSSINTCSVVNNILCAVAAKVYTKVPSELLPADSYYLPSVEYMKDIVAEFPLSAHTPGDSLTAMASASAHSSQPTADAQ